MVLIHPDALAHQSTQAPIVSRGITVGWFQVYARYGRGLSDQDGWWAGYSDPYLDVTVYDYLGFRVRRLTHHVAENRNPV